MTNESVFTSAVYTGLRSVALDDCGVVVVECVQFFSIMPDMF